MGRGCDCDQPHSWGHLGAGSWRKRSTRCMRYYYGRLTEQQEALQLAGGELGYGQLAHHAASSCAALPPPLLVRGLTGSCRPIEPELDTVTSMPGRSPATETIEDAQQVHVVCRDAGQTYAPTSRESYVCSAYSGNACSCAATQGQL